MLCIFTGISLGEAVADPPEVKTTAATAAASSAATENAQQTGARLKAIPMRPKYQGEEARGVLYYRGEERARHRVTVRDGMLWDHAGKPVNAGVKAPEGSTLSFPEGEGPHDRRQWGFAIYALDLDGQLYISFDGQRGRIHHSTFLAGAPVACAGEMIIFDGRVFALNNQSGHYQPPPSALKQLTPILARGGIDLSKVRVKRFGLDLFPGGPPPF